jgi:uncharacterized protein YjbI with pentapeptide repeats
MIKINDVNNKLMYEVSANTVKEALEKLIKEKADLFNAELPAALKFDADLFGSYLNNFNLAKQGMPLPKIDPPRPNLSYANLSDIILSNIDLSDANLSYSDLSGTNLSCANLFHANLNFADLSHADLSHADLSHADLSHADLSFAKLYKTKF